MLVHYVDIIQYTGHDSSKFEKGEGNTLEGSAETISDTCKILRVQNHYDQVLILILDIAITNF